MRVVPFLTTALLFILSMNPEVTSQSNCYIKTNGCSVPLDLPFIYKNTFRPACVKHDVCYSCVRYGISLLICVIFIHTNIIVPFWYPSATYLVIMVEPWLLSHSWGETKQVCSVVEAYQRGTIRYLPHLNLAMWAWYRRISRGCHPWPSQRLMCKTLNTTEVIYVWSKKELSFD